MNATRHLFILVTLLVIVAIGVFWYKTSVLKWPFQPDESAPVWALEVKVDFTPNPKTPIKVDFYLPPQQPYFDRLGENFVSRSYAVTTNTTDNNRLSVWTIRRATGPQSLYYRVNVFPTKPNQTLRTTKRPELLADYHFAFAEKSAADAILNQVRAKSYDSLTFAIETLKLLTQPDDNVELLLKNDQTMATVVNVATHLLAGAKIPARSAHGVFLNPDITHRKNIEFSTFLSIWADGQWHYINPYTLTSGLPANFFIWWYGDSKIISVDGGRNPVVSLSTTKSLQSSFDIARELTLKENSKFYTFSLFNLPLETQHVYQILIMVPLGAFIILLLRNIIGIQTFGTFMPVLIALAFKETELIYGILMFTLILSLGLAVRFYLEHLKLLLIPRIATVLSIVVLIMISLSVVGNQLGLTHGLSIALFPMVILTMTIERMSVIWEERNAWEAITQAAGSLLSAVLTYLVMTNAYAEYLFFAFPELLLILIALMLLMGRYRGYRFTELTRFKYLMSGAEK